MINPFSIEGKVILVTGATSGIGRATAVLCAQMGATVIAVGRNKGRLKEMQSALESEGGIEAEHLYISTDLTDTEQVKALVEQVPAIDGIANCAGIAHMNPFQFITQEEVEIMMQNNFVAPVMLVNRLLKEKKLKKGCSVVFVSSVDGQKIVHAGNSAYSASKSALVGMARNMAVELASKKIRVNCVLPGTTDTPMVRTENVTEEVTHQTNNTGTTIIGGEGDDYVFNNAAKVQINGGAGADSFFVGKGEGNDSIRNASAADSVNLYNVRLSDIVGTSENNGTISLALNTGNTISVQSTGNLSARFNLTNGSYRFNHATKAWQNA